MAKSSRKKAKRVISSKAVREQKDACGKAQLSENVECLVELHKLQGVLLAQLQRETR